MLNISFQGQNPLVSELSSHVKAFKTKPQLFQRHLSQTEPFTTHFPALQNVTIIGSTCVEKKEYAEALIPLASNFNNRFWGFAAIEKEIMSFISPFSVNPDEAPKNLQLELIELQCDNEWLSRLQHLSLVPIYPQPDKSKFPEIRTFAKKILSLFGSTYLCEPTFSVMNLNKNRLRSKLSDSLLRDILLLNTSTFEPDLTRILKSRSQFHFSH